MMPQTTSGLHLGRLALPSNLALAPLAGWTSLAFREALRALGGVGLAVTEVVSARSLTTGHQRTWNLCRTSPADRPLAVQIQARTEEDAAEAARRIEDRGYAAIDLNLGCPVRKVSRKGGGAALGVLAAEAARVAGAAVRAASIPVTAKLRLGWDQGDLTAPAVARALEAEGIALVTVHGRTRAQAFAGPVSLAGIAAVVEAVSIPVIANGDILTAEDGRRMLAETGAAGLMIGRGAVEDPWIFQRTLALLGGEAPPPPTGLAPRVGFIRDHYARLCVYEGEVHASRVFRKVLRTYGWVLGAGEAFAREAVRIERPADVEALLERLLAGRYDPLCPPPPGGLVPAPKQPTDHW